MSKTGRISVAWAVSDADVLIKLCRAGYLELLPATVERIHVPQYVLGEAQARVPRQEQGLTLAQACGQDWLSVLDTRSGSDFTAAQRQAMNATRQTFRYVLDNGELEAVALAIELGIPYLTSDDRNARNIIEAGTDVRVLRLIDLLYICGKNRLTECADIKSIFESIQAGESYPLGGTFEDNFRSCRRRLKEVGLLR